MITNFNRRLFVRLATTALVVLCGCDQFNIDSRVMEERAEELRKMKPFRYPLDEYFPEIPVTAAKPPRGEKYHTGEDKF